MNMPVHDLSVDEMGDVSNPTEDVTGTKRQFASNDCRAAIEAARLLVEAYRRGGERGGSTEWEDIDRAYEAALRAVGNGE